MGRQTKRQRERKRAAKDTTQVVVAPKTISLTGTGVQNQKHRVVIAAPKTRQNVYGGAGLSARDVHKAAGLSASAERANPGVQESVQAIGEAWKKLTANRSIAASVRESSNKASVVGAFSSSNPNIGKNAVPSDIQKQAAIERLKALTDILQSKPTPILEQLTAIGIEYKIVHNVPGDPRYDTVVILMEHIKQAEAEIANRGTLYEQIYKKSQELHDREL